MGRGGSISALLQIFYLLTSDDIYCYILNYIKYVKCFKSLISTLQTHQQNLCVKQTASKIRTKFIINNNVYVKKIIKVISSLNIRRRRTSAYMIKDDKRRLRNKNKKNQKLQQHPTVFN